jgi:prepilin-type N-terminal cleavage/methylation domain-containing protein
MRRGYSLIEFSVAMAIAGVLALTALSAFSMLNRSVFSMRARSIAETKLQRTLSSLVSDAQEVGGGAIRPWHSVFVAPGDGASNDADRLLLLTVPPSAGVCGISKKAGPNLFAEKDPGTGKCCLDGLFPKGDGGGSGGSGSGGVLPPGGDGDDDDDDDDDPPVAGGLGVVAVEIDGEPAILGKVGLAECKVDLEPLFADDNGGLLTTETKHDDRWANATLSPASAKLIFLDPTTKSLRAWMLTSAANGEDCPPPSKLAPADDHALRGLRAEGLCFDERILAEDVEDFQVALGYDIDASGSISEEQRVGVAEEWLGNAAAEFEAGKFAGLQPLVGKVVPPKADQAGFPRELLRGISFGVIVSLPVLDERTRPRQQVLDGPRRGGPRQYLSAGIARGLFRNTGVFQ